MSFPKAHFTQFSKNPIAYRQYAPDDPVDQSIHDINMECDASLRYQNRAILVVDSKDRKIRENPNRYSIRLNKTYKDVVSVELRKANLPNSDYVINKYNNAFYFQDSDEMVSTDSYHQIRLPEGDYLIDDPVKDSIRSLLEQGLNAADPANTYTVTIDHNTHLFTFTQTAGSGIFNILFKYPKVCDGSPGGDNDLPNHIGEVIGYKRINHVGHTSYMAEYVHNLRPSNYLIIRIQGWERIDSNHFPAQDAFCILPLDTRLNNFMLSNNCDQLDNEVYQKDFNPPLGTMDRLNIEILNENGDPYNFRGRDHFLVFEIVSLSRHSNYHRYSQAPGKGR